MKNIVLGFAYQGSPKLRLLTQNCTLPAKENPYGRPKMTRELLSSYTNTNQIISRNYLGILMLSQALLFNFIFLILMCQMREVTCIYFNKELDKLGILNPLRNLIRVNRIYNTNLGNTIMAIRKPNSTNI